MYARVNTFLGSPARFEEGIADARDNAVPAMQKIDGFQGLMVLLDRASGRSIGITFWDSEDELRASEQAAARVRHDHAVRSEDIVLSVERYEIALDTTR